VTQDQSELLQKASQSLDAAKLLLANNYPDYATSRAYYAMFYLAEAFLEGENLTFSKHSAVIAAFGREFARTNRLPLILHRYLIEAQALRTVGDYGQLNAVTLEQASVQINRAEEFLAIARQQIA
jgi:uncharacterized protein (UPF0332 family)